jgi:FkbM family methyltransferase
MFSTLKFILSHPLNRGRPLSALARYVWWQILSRLKHEVVVEWVDGTRLVARNGMTGATGNVYCGLHEYADMSFVLHLLRPGDLFVDVGANIGSYTVLASGVCGARTLAIEPNRETVRNLERNIAANGLEDHVDLKVTAVGEKAGTIAFTTGLDTMNRVAVAGDRDVQTVPLARLDDLLDGCAAMLIKMDVEGFETPALRGAEGTLSSPSLIAVMLETVDDDAHAQLARHGFEKFGYDPRIRKLVDPTFATGSNFLFVKDRANVEERVASAPRRKVSGSYV